MKDLEELVDFAADAVRSIIAEGVSKAMTKYNRRAPGSNIEEE
jgi:PTH1 family peptidyl-tRNA hydrolase